MVLHDDRSRSFLRRANVLFLFTCSTRVLTCKSKEAYPLPIFVPSARTSAKLSGYCLTMFCTTIWHCDFDGLTSCFRILSTNILTSSLRSAGDGLFLFAMANLIPGGMTSQATLNVSAQEQDAEEQAEELDGVELEELSDPGLDVSERTSCDERWEVEQLACSNRNNQYINKK